MPILRVHDREYALEGILFDKDGTLLDFMSLWGRWAVHLTESVVRKLEELGLHEASLASWQAGLMGLERDELGRWTGYDAEGPLAMASVSESEGLLAWQLYRAGMPWNEAITAIREYVRQAGEAVERERAAVPLPGLMTLLEACERHAVPLAVVTADRTGEAAKHLGWMGARRYFREVIGSDLVKRGKPHPEMVYAACERMGLRPDQVAVFGDTNGDMQMGRAAGAAVTIGISASTEAGRRQLVDADEIIRDYRDVRILT